MTPLKDWRDSDLSALFDDELLADEAQNCVAGVAKNQTMLTHWCDYQDVRAGLQGEVMHASSSAFLTGFRERLAQEQTQPEAVVTVPQSGMPAANDAVFRWKLVAGLSGNPAFLHSAARSETSSSWKRDLFKPCNLG